MKTHGLSFDDVNAVLSQEEGVLYWKVSRGGKLIGSRAGSINTRNGLHYAFVRINKKAFMTANVVFLLTHGRWPASIIDHEDGDTLNNRPSNLRETTQAGNMKNRARSRLNRSGITGVSWHKNAGKWRAYIRGPSGIRHLGLFDDIALAATARKQAEVAFGYHPNHGRAPR